MPKTRKKTKPGSSQNEEWMTLPDAARQAGLHRQTVLKKAGTGVFEAQDVAGYTFIRRASVERYLEEQKR